MEIEDRRGKRDNVDTIELIGNMSVFKINGTMLIKLWIGDELKIINFENGELVDLPLNTEVKRLNARLVVDD